MENTDNINKAAVELKDGCNAHGRSKIKLIGSEREMRDYVVANIDKIIGAKPASIQIEAKSDAGSVDVYAETDSEIFLLEIKRKTANVSAAGQLQRYADTIRRTASKVIKQVLIAPRVSPNCQRLMDTNGQALYQLSPDSITGNSTSGS